MKRIRAAVITVVTASTLIWPAAAGAASAAPVAVHAGAKLPVAPGATLRVVPRWTYQHGGKIAVIARCSPRRDLRVVTSGLLRHPVLLRRGGNLLIVIGPKTNAGKYTITLWCVSKNNQVDAIDVKSVKILKRFGRFKQPVPPGLPKHFRPNVTVTSGPPAPPAHGRKKGH